MGSFAAFAILIPIAVGEVSFDEHLQRFGKSYAGEEYEQRKAVFQQAVAEVEELNARPDKLWTAGLSELSHLLPGELARRRGYNKMLRATQGAHQGTMPSLVSMAAVASDLPTSVDWRRHTPTVVTPVKSQGSCGSCWAFSAAETIESHVAINTGVLMSLSPQQANSCAPNPNKCGGSGGCTGATAQLAFNYTIEAGISSIWTTPYESGITGATGQCEPGWYSPAAGITGYETLLANDGDALAEAVANIGPVSVSVDASIWGLYQGGIFDGCNKTNPDINHAVQLVGYGEENGTKYWLVRNSWGAFWGEDGYIRVKRHDDEPCGTDITPDHGFGCEGGPSQIRVCGECGILSDSSYPTGASDGFRRRLQAESPVHV